MTATPGNGTDVEKFRRAVRQLFYKTRCVFHAAVAAQQTAQAGFKERRL
jgi:hypothetical protein